MKKVLSIGILFVFLLSFSVEAVNFKLKDLIDKNKEVTIVGDNFRYLDFSYKEKNKEITFIMKNYSKEEVPATIIIGFFDEGEKNIGTIYYCDRKSTLKIGEEVPIQIKVDSTTLADKKELTDIRYISVIGENKGCITSGKDDFVGKRIEEIGKTPSSMLTKDVETLLKVLVAVAILFVVIFLYKLLYTNSYENFDGNDVRRAYKKRFRKINSSVKQEKEQEKIEKVEIMEEEQETDTDLHKLYK